MITPERTLAIVVGVETYRAGALWDLDGPALDACKFATWLHEQGVPKQNITLLVSPLLRNTTEIENTVLGFPRYEATGEHVRRMLVTQLPDLASEYFILYWGGHGVIDSADVRRLLYADAITSDKRNLNLTSYINALRSTRYGGHPQQLIIVDACLSQADELGWKDLPDETFGPVQNWPQREQWALFAASPGQRARNDDARRTGLFSDVIRQSIIWPPDADSLREKIKIRFEQLRAAEKNTQVPSSMWYQSRSQEDRLVFGIPPASVRLTARALGSELLERAEFKELRSILLGAPAPAGLRGHYQDATRNLLTLPLNPDDLMSSIAALRLAVDAMPLFDFLVRISAASQDPPTREQLDCWIERTAPRWNVDLGAIDELRAELSRTVILVQLKPDMIGAGYQVTAWTYTGADGRQSATTEEPWMREQIGTLLSTQLTAYLDDFDPRNGSTQVAVEFLLGLDLLNEDFEALKVTVGGAEYEIGTVCPVVVRSLDRIGKLEWVEPWRGKWRALKQHGCSYDEDAICWIVDRAGVSQLSIDLLRTCVALVYPHDDDRCMALLTALEVGTPVVVWHRAPASRRRPQEALESVLGAAGLLDLPERVMRQRINAKHPAVGSDHSGRDLVLLWDDPERIPSDIQWHEPTFEGARP